MTGRKGSGKTALFLQVRDNLRSRDKHGRIVLDLKPEGFQIRKFKDVVLSCLEEGTKEHTVRAFWEYLICLEICHKILQKDQSTHVTDHTIADAYRRMSVTYHSDTFVSEGDFAERMTLLLNRIATDFSSRFGEQGGALRLSRDQITEVLYRHDLPKLRGELVEYLSHKSGLWILVDNLDKGWSAYGVTDEDVLILRCLLDALANRNRSRPGEE